jgi:hypothetical protein
MYFQSFAFPQRLKPDPICRFLGTAKAVPVQNDQMAGRVEFFSKLFSRAAKERRRSWA